MKNNTFNFSAMTAAVINYIDISAIETAFNSDHTYISVNILSGAVSSRMIDFSDLPKLTAAAPVHFRAAWYRLQEGKISDVVTAYRDALETLDAAEEVDVDAAKAFRAAAAIVEGRAAAVRELYAAAALPAGQVIDYTMSILAAGMARDVNAINGAIKSTIDDVLTAVKTARADATEVINVRDLRAALDKAFKAIWIVGDGACLSSCNFKTTDALARHIYAVCESRFKVVKGRVTMPTAANRNALAVEVVQAVLWDLNERRKAAEKAAEQTAAKKTEQAAEKPAEQTAAKTAAKKAPAKKTEKPAA